MPDKIDIIKNNKTAAYRYLAAEAAVAAVIAIILLFSIDTTAAWSAVMGGAVFIAPNWVFTGVVFRHTEADSARSILHRFFIGEMLKIFITILLFAACFILVRPLNVIALFATFLAMMVINILGLATLRTNN